MRDIKVNQYGFSRRSKSKKKQTFKMGKSLVLLDELIPSLPKSDESIRAVSYQGGFSSISFIALIAEKEKIEELTASTLRVGRKQFKALQRLKEENKLNKASFVIGTIMRENTTNNKNYRYYEEFKEGCKENNWKYATVNNHSKLILMRTKDNYYVLETSSNLNENPKIEQFTLENDKGLYMFYYNLLNELINEVVI